MSYFDFFDLPLSLDIDEAELKQKFYANSKKFHPDFFTLNDVEQQMEALELSTKNNSAYKTLINFDKRLHYILTIKNILDEEGKNQIPQDFLMEMMEVNEAVMELQFDFDPEAYQKIIADIADTKAELKKEIETIIPKQGDEITASDFETLKSYYLKSKYLIRLEENIKKLEP
ncbi:Fe-S protein assembly co-chaperone HscB [Portibacter lacus]|uniref:Co-chaperone protein HscB n=1 Tax=Portibacter lacus TaxID=1099794 RepID=A0AA37WCZ3_9BACT|nr:Fe-S protein assembly co-chaperone HscB [Portibacter lacus]GLR17276.1 co-chaperone protein HscB [Portibacter lacus]